ncbi:MAG: hypothetical protein KKA84_10175 [Bacteroidetes bacterium]|nr:hypothetical protein [Bacteroidota bacterium]
MRKLVFIFFILISVLFSNENVLFKSAVPNFTTISGMQKVADFDFDSKSNIYFLESTQKKIFIYDQSGNFIDDIPLPNLKKPVAIRISAEDKIYILDSDNANVIVISKTGAIIDVFGNNGSTDTGVLSEPYYMYSDSEDNLFVLDNNQKVLKYTSEGLFRGSSFVDNAIALTVDREQTIHILKRGEDNKYFIQSLTENFQIKDQINISNLYNPVDIGVNYFGEYYIVDAEVAKVFRYGKLGNIIGEPIGKKGNSKERGQFGEPYRIKYKYVNNETDNITILDARFSLTQSFDVNSFHEREKLADRKTFLPINFDSITESINFSKYFYSKGYEFFQERDNKIVVRKDGVELYSISGSGFDEIVGISCSHSEIFIGDRGTEKVKRYNLQNGSFISEFNYSFSEILGLQIDSQNNLYVAVEGELLIFSPDGNLVFSTKDKGLGYIGNLQSMSISGDDILYLKFSEDKYYNTFDLRTKAFTQTKINITDISNIDLIYASAPNGLVFAYEANSGQILILEDGFHVDQFLCKGSDKLQMEQVDKIYFDSDATKLYLADYKNSVRKCFRISLPSIHNLRLELDDLGFAKLVWEADKSGAKGYKLFRRQNSSQVFQQIAEVSETNYTILEEVNQVYEYAIRTVYQSKGDGPFSNSVTDEFTYAKTIRFKRPEEAIDIMMQFRDLNRGIIDNQILSVYRDLVNKFKNEEKYELALNNVTKMKVINPQNYAFYIERSELLEQLRKYNDAMDELETAKSKFPNNANIYYHLINLYKLQNDNRKIITLANEALAQFASDEQILSAVAQAYYNLKIYNESARYYRVLYQQTGNSDYSIEAGRIFVAQGKYDEALNLYEQMRGTGKISGTLSSAIAEAYIAKNDLNSAVDEVNKGLAIDASSANLYYLLGVIHEKKGDLNSAVTAYKKAINLDDTKASYNIALADILYNTSAKDDATFYYETAVLYSPENTDALLKLGSIYLENNQLDYAYRHLSKAYQLNSGDRIINEKYNAAREKRKIQNALREPVEFNYIDMGDVDFSSLESFNSSNFGSVTIFNTRNEPISNILIEITCADLLALPLLITVPLLQPNEFMENYFNFKVDENLGLKLPASRKETDVIFTISYNYEGTSKTFSQRKIIKIIR